MSGPQRKAPKASQKPSSPVPWLELPILLLPQILSAKMRRGRDHDHNQGVEFVIHPLAGDHGSN